MCVAIIILLNFGAAVCVLNGTLCFNNHAFAFFPTVSLLSSFLSSARNNVSVFLFCLLDIILYLPDTLPSVCVWHTENIMYCLMIFWRRLPLCFSTTSMPFFLFNLGCVVQASLQGSILQDHLSCPKDKSLFQRCCSGSSTLSNVRTNVMIFYIP